MTKLQCGTSQLLKSVILEYDAFFTTALGGGIANTAFQQSQQQQQNTASDNVAKPEGTSGWTKSHMWSDVRSFLKNLQQDSSSPMQDRLQATLQGLPTHMVDKMMGKTEQKQVSSAEEAQTLTKQFEQVTGNLATPQIASFTSSSPSVVSSKLASSKAKQPDNAAIRAKYMDKINRLKAQAAQQQNLPSTAIRDNQSSSVEDSAGSRKGLGSWIVKPGTNEMLSYIALRGLSSAIIPPFSTLQIKEFDEFMDKMGHDFDVCLRREQLQDFPDAKPLLKLSKKLHVQPHEVLVVSAHNEVVEAARRAGMNCCYCLPTPEAMRNHNAQYQLEHVKDLKFVIEDFNGISYRR